MKKKVMSRAAMLMLTAVLLFPQMLLTAYAEDIVFTDCSKLMEATDTVDATIQPNSNSEVIATFEKGSPIMVTGESETGWYRITYQGQDGYVKTDTVKAAVQVEGESLEELDRELEEMEQTNKIIVEEVERMRAEQKRSLIWTVVIVILVISIFAVGIYSTVKANRKDAEDGRKAGDDKETEFLDEEDQPDDNLEDQLIDLSE